MMMTPYSTVVSTGSPHAVRCLGIDFVSRRGLAGVPGQASPLSKSASLQAINQMGYAPVNNVELIGRRGHMTPQTGTPRCDSQEPAGALPRDRRRPDIPEAVRRTSIDHQVHRWRSAPQPATTTGGPVDAGDQNLIISYARIADGAEAIGRSRSPAERQGSKSPAVSRAGTPRCPSPRFSPGGYASVGATLGGSASTPRFYSAQSAEAEEELVHARQQDFQVNPRNLKVHQEEQETCRSPRKPKVDTLTPNQRQRFAMKPRNPGSLSKSSLVSRTLFGEDGYLDHKASSPRLANANIGGSPSQVVDAIMTSFVKRLKVASDPPHSPQMHSPQSVSAATTTFGGDDASVSTSFGAVGSGTGTSASHGDTGSPTKRSSVFLAARSKAAPVVVAAATALGGKLLEDKKAGKLCEERLRDLVRKEQQKALRIAQK
eukprot:TRINITY_DN3754_c0_g1_i1.p1 TRINITY_DN3754_c0_g1~~TRINITY_DN3754_c0_g1_i1.p1  ORF type:complete len:431 (+),score=78.11 TRINITY_DN3754_c0_g1_i1:161-1453(+)